MLKSKKLEWMNASEIKKTSKGILVIFEDRNRRWGIMLPENYLKKVLESKVQTNDQKVG